jgi:hypothetical protein
MNLHAVDAGWFSLFRRIPWDFLYELLRQPSPIPRLRLDFALRWS